jgi:hypothetical protein
MSMSISGNPAGGSDDDGTVSIAGNTPGAEAEAAPQILQRRLFILILMLIRPLLPATA